MGLAKNIFQKTLEIAKKRPILYNVGLGKSPQEQKGLKMKNTNNDFFKKHVIICGIPDGKEKEKITKQIVETGSVKMTDLARAMGITVVEQ